MKITLNIPLEILIPIVAIWILGIIANFILCYIIIKKNLKEELEFNNLELNLKNYVNLFKRRQSLTRLFLLSSCSWLVFIPNLITERSR